MVNNMVMVKTNVAEFKAKLSEYLDRAVAGERIVICRHNTPVAELLAVEQARREPRAIGRLPGRPTFSLDPSFFDALPDDELERWEGGRAAPGLDRLASAGTMRVAESKPTYGPRAKRTARRRRS
jgi:prevent-host-death family protein